MQKPRTNVTTIHFRIRILSVFLFGLMGLSGFAQETITGMITGPEGGPLPGVNVVQKGTNNGVSADFDGNFSITLKEGSDILEFSSVGYASKEVSTGGQTTLNVSLEEDAQNLDEVVVIGYSPIAREKVLGATVNVKEEDIVKATPVNAFDAVQGRLSGVQILSNGGPGAGFDVRVRGVATFSSGTSPLYVVDGQQLENIDNLNPNDIATFEVLKDGATTAIYGSRGANGVVLITTKSAKSGDVKIEITSNTSTSTLNGSIPLANTRQRIFYEDVRRGGNTNLTGIQRDSLSLLNRNSSDLQELLTRTAYRQQLNVAVSGGGEKTSMYWNTGFQEQEGIVVNSSYKNINSRFKLEFRPTDKLTLGTNLNVSFENQLGLNEGQVFQQMVERIAYFPVFEPNGTFTPEIAGRQNPLAEANLRTLRDRNFRAQSFTYGQYKITPSLSFKSTLGLNFRYRKQNEFSPSLTQNPNSAIPRGSELNFLDYDIQQENFFNYSNTFGEHSLSAFGGMQILKYYSERTGFNAQFVSDDIQTFNGVDPLTLAVDTDFAGGLRNTGNERHNLFSLFAGLNYDYKNKYLLGFTIRRDGSSRFGDNQKYGNFPSFNVGWRLSNEGFMENTKDVVNNLLFRASYGETGNENIGNYDAISSYSPGYAYNGISGFAPTRLGNPNITWESTISKNFGVDLGMFKNRLNITLDVWEKETKDLLAVIPLPEESGFSGLRQNVGAVVNTGIDFSINGTLIKTENFSWNSGFNISTLKNEVTQLKDGTPFQSGDYLIEEGESLGNIFGYRNLGIYEYDESNAYTPEGVRLTPNFDADGTFVNHTLDGAVYAPEPIKLRNAGNELQGGDIIWEDLNNDFDINIEDKQTVGNGLPEFYGGFTSDFIYKGFGMSFLLDYTFGNDLWRLYDEQRNDLNSSNETPGPDRIEGAWLQPGDVTVYPRLDRVAQNREGPNSFFVTKGDFIKLRYVRFSYGLPKLLMDEISWVNDVSFNLSFNNFFTWTNYVGYNPELGSRGNALQPGRDTLRYPNSREIIFGIKVQL